MDKYRLRKEEWSRLLCMLLLCFIVNYRFISESYSTVMGGGKLTFVNLTLKPVTDDALIVQAKNSVVLSAIPLFISSKAAHRDGAWRESSATTFDDVDINVIDSSSVDPESDDDISARGAYLALNIINCSNYGSINGLSAA